MVRLIDADAIEHCLVIGGRRHGKTIISEIIYRAIQAAPTVDAVPVRHAKLLNAHPYGECSNCGYLIDMREEFNYCPNCGAKMDEEDDDETNRCRCTF